MSLVKRLFSSKDRARQDPVDLSIVVVAYDMARELPRTLQSLTRDYQLNANSLNYEVIVVDNGSPAPLQQAAVEKYGEQFRLLTVPDASPSPAHAVNLGVESSNGTFVGVIIDGARLLSPGILHWAMRAFSMDSRSLVSVPGMHLGPDIQRLSVQQGYDKAKEDQLLQRISWPEDGYRLFEISCLAGSAILGWAGPMAESNCVLLPKAVFDELGGYDEKFSSPGGGLVNLDFYRRCCEATDMANVYLVGEGCFHQLHGGVTTGGDQVTPTRFDDLQAEYTSIRGKPFTVPQKPATLFGELPPGAVHLSASGALRFLSDKHDAKAVHDGHMTAVGLPVKPLG